MSVEQLSQDILKDLLADFVGRNLSVQELSHQHVGVAIESLKKKYAGDNTVDFDLALKELMESKLVDTGPSVPYENEPGSGLVFIGFYSKNEYAYLTEKGYKAAKKVKVPRMSGTNRVHISGGNFHHSPIGIGGHVTQSVATSGNAPVFMDLHEAVQKSAIEPAQQAELITRIEAMEHARKTPGFVERYADFIACAANHMTLIAPFIPALTAEMMK
jgi:hypothetical protein